jgi:hypothetical protein
MPGLSLRDDTNLCFTERLNAGRATMASTLRKPTVVPVNMGTRRQASNLKGEQANNSHGYSWHKMLASYETLFVSDSKKGASQLQS